MTGLLRLDHKRRAVLDLAEALRDRIAGREGVAPHRVLLASTPEAFALVGLDGETSIRIGPDIAPVCALLGEFTDAQRQVETTVTVSGLKSALDALSGPGQAASLAEARDRTALLRAAAEIIEAWPAVDSVAIEAGSLVVSPNDPAALQRQLKGLGILADTAPDGISTLHCPDAASARALAERVCVTTGRTASARRTTKETDISVSLDLGRDGPVRAETGIEFFDHMLDQVGRHGGFALDVVAIGDVGVDAHHTIEDVCLALGEALRHALGGKRGLARFGFELPMDETRAGVWIDLSGRPYCRFEGRIPGERVAGFPVEMTPHAFRSLADAMKASIHVRVDGDNAHHMIEACFKAFGRALRQAVRVEGDAIPSTKGAL